MRSLPLAIFAAGLTLACLFGAGWGCGPSRRDLEQQAASQGALAGKHFNERNFSEALTATREAIRLNTDLRNDSAMADNELMVANCQRQLGEYDSALESFQRTIEYFHSLNDQHLERRARIALADFYNSMFRDADALAIASDAATAARVFSDTGDSYRALTVVARSNHRLGRFDDELAALTDLARIDSQAYRGRDRVILLRSMMKASEGSGDQDKCDEIFNRWKGLAVSAGDTPSLAEAWYERGLYMQSLGRPDGAALALSQALGFAGKSGDAPLRANILSALGNLAYGAKRFEDARRHYVDALQLARTEDSFVLRTILVLAIVACDSKTGAESPGSAVPDLIKRCTAIAGECRQNGFSRGEALANFISGRLSEMADDPAAAMPFYRSAAGLHEQSPLQPETRDLNFVETYLRGEEAGWYDPLIRLSCGSGQVDSAFSDIERRNLLDLAGFFSRISLKTADRNLNRKISQVQWNLSALRLLQGDLLHELGAATRQHSGHLASLNGAVPRREAELKRSVSELAAINSNFPWLLDPARLQLAAIRDTLAPNTALVEYAPAGDTLYSIVIGNHRAVLRVVPVNQPYLLGLIGEYNRLAGGNRLSSNGTWITEPATQSRLNTLSSVLGKFLLSPIMQDLGGVEKLYVTLPEEFGWLPLHTLRLEDRPLAGRMNVSYLPTAAVLLFSSDRERPVRRVIGVGHPGRTSWDVEYELKDIRGFYENARMLFDTLATLRHMMDSTYDVVHIVGEFEVDREVPGNSRLILAEGITPFGVRGASLGELLAVPRPQALVLGNISPQAGGLLRYAPLAFLANGTKTVIASAWQVDRKAKKLFGEGFYTGLLSGLSPSEAYRHALENLMKQGEFPLLQRWGAYYQYGR